MFWDTDESSGVATTSGKVATRAPLELPPELKGELDLPVAEKGVELTASAAPLPERYAEAVAGKPVALSARLYKIQPGQLLSSVVDAMTLLNLPVNSVDSPSGIITTDWVRKGQEGFSDVMMGSIGMSGAIKVIRYRFIVRVFKLKGGEAYRSRLEVRLLTQGYQNSHWVNKRSLPNRSDELFGAVEKQVGRIPPPTVSAEAEPAR
ncbi:hypothetical protein [Mariprofundus aestuarium]|nr:hypothetical protein [Mariprofundus aestuarium]